MEQHRDEHIICADCGESFLFSAGEAALFAERKLASPKRCKSCRKARKERGAHEGSGAHRRPEPAFGNAQGGSFRGDARGGRRPSAPVRYTGDVNEYRSPMQDRSMPGPVAWPTQNDRAPRGRRPTTAQTWLNDGVYRAPSSFGNERPSAPRGRSNPQAGGRPGPRRAPAQLFQITCSQCGTDAEVPFQPAEGRDVFCQACYRARKPA